MVYPRVRATKATTACLTSTMNEHKESDGELKPASDSDQAR
ncbi:hypothetical protein PC119_g11697 [Phytophthora cactorum]|nr:hypothetical protein PC114_g12115 [Phytophthora cactorum]KAG3015622.1 hypothetical protein PC119_g11697 [Phytophthora cactorum]KAG3018959.1 hypothetical protein PC120_g10131 [Phytophthora cactorum]KAG3164832.1 hypothetical protein C6341_g12562 [Phytophthora cactorum]KAG4052204.1 hypothetical protein PC123_g12629 [Phytophthora cactorum]